MNRSQFLEGDATMHFSVKKKGVFSKKRGGIQRIEVEYGFLQERQFSEEVQAIQ